MRLRLWHVGLGRLRVGLSKHPGGIKLRWVKLRKQVLTRKNRRLPERGQLGRHVVQLVGRHVVRLVGQHVVRLLGQHFVRLVLIV